MKDRAYWSNASIYRACPLCDSDGYILVSTSMQHALNLNTVLCRKCSFVFTNPLPSRQVYEEFYRQGYATHYGHLTPKPPHLKSSAEPPHIRAKLGRLGELITLNGRRLLEVGPGGGLFLYWAQNHGLDVLGVEPTPEFCKALSDAGLPHIRASLLDLPSHLHGQFDIIYMSHVLEHFYDPNDALHCCRQLLKTNGILAIEVPNICKPFRSLDHYFLRYVHPSNFSTDTLCAFLEKHGFACVSCEEGGQDWRSPQNLSVIARRRSSVGSGIPCAVGNPDFVLRTLSEYRQTWKWKIAPRWYARSTFLEIMRSVKKLGRLVKRILLRSTFL